MRYVLFCCLFGVLLAASCAPKSDKRSCTKSADCLGGEACVQGFCETAGPDSCQTGQTRPCYTGPQGTDGKGLCRAGVQACQNGTWAQGCANEVKPVDELCDGLDNNCDGQVDNLTTKPPEQCDGVDNDCDGRVDNVVGGDLPLTRACYTGATGSEGKGPCRGGNQTCTNGAWPKQCPGEVTPKEEICQNQVDDDCDGVTDNIKDLGKPCTDTKLPTGCQNGTYACDPNNGQRYCKPLQAKPETCNNQDDDCDGRVDNIRSTSNPITQDCSYNGPAGTKGVGICQAAKQTCQNGQWSNQCTGEVLPKTEECNGVDDDCDGRVDNTKGTTQSLKRPCYGGPKETRAKGECKDGTEACVQGKWGGCQGDTRPTDELCGNNKDEDCDGTVDNVKNIGASCLDASRKGACQEGVLQCQGATRACRQTVNETPEVCNGRDDDCDGNIDNVKGTTNIITRACYTDAAGTKDKGACKAGVQACEGGRWSDFCKGEVIPHIEVCNTQDDDCDGQTDEAPACDTCTAGTSRPCYPGPTRTRNISPCKDGQELCQQGRWSGQCTGATTPQTEVCDGVDNDCDGRVDNQPGSTSPLARACYTGPGGQRNKGSCSDGVQRCLNGRWEVGCLGEIKSETEICDNRDNDCDGQTDEGDVCTKDQNRQLREMCSTDPTALTYQKCAFGLQCLQALPNDYREHCYQPCTGGGSCANNKDGRTICLALDQNRRICVRQSDDGAPCDLAWGYLCKPGLFCDMGLRRCRRMTQVPADQACGGQTGSECDTKNGYTCAELTPGAPTGYCLKQCVNSGNCDTGTYCTSFVNGVLACMPSGSVKIDQTCGGNSGDKVDPKLYCEKGLLCTRPNITNPYGICWKAYAQCQQGICGAGRVCIPYGGGVACAKTCGTCAAGQRCVNVGANINICLPNPPVGPIPFGGMCNASNLCQKDLVCLTPSAQRYAGYCSKFCNTDGDCPQAPSGAKCQVLQTNIRACIFPCTTNTDCPGGLVCDGNQSICQAP